MHTVYIYTYIYIYMEGERKNEREREREREKVGKWKNPMSSEDDLFIVWFFLSKLNVLVFLNIHIKTEKKTLPRYLNLFNEKKKRKF